MQDLLGDLAGQLLFPTLYVASIATVFLALTGHGMGPTGAWLGTLAFGLTPMLLNPGAGAVDSGYAEMFLIYALLLAGCGLLLADLRFLFLGALLLPLIKPEGTAYAITLGLVTATTACRRHHYATTWGLTCALMLWLPLRSGDHGALSIAGPLLIGGGLCALHELVRRFSRATVLLITSSLAVAMLATIFLAEEALRSSNNFLLRDFVVHVVELGPRLINTPTLLLGYIKAVVSLNDFGLLFILVLALLLSPKRLVGTTPCRPLAWFLVGGLTLACAAMLLSPDPDLTHVFRSRFDRLLLHWAGPAWLLTSAWVFQAPDPAAQPEPPTYAASAWESSNDPRGSGKQP